MNGYSEAVQKMSDEQLAKELARCRADDRMKYASPATDAHWYYKALLEESNDRKRSKVR